MPNMSMGILQILEDNGGPMLFDEVIEKLRPFYPEALTFDLRSAVLPLLSSGQVYFTKADRTTIELYDRGRI